MLENTQEYNDNADIYLYEESFDNWNYQDYIDVKVKAGEFFDEFLNFKIED